MIGTKTTFLAVLFIGALVVYLYTTGSLNNTSNLTGNFTALLLFGIFAIALALEFDLFEISQKPTIPAEIKVVQKETGF